MGLTPLNPTSQTLTAAAQGSLSFPAVGMGSAIPGHPYCLPGYFFPDQWCADYLIGMNSFGEPGTDEGTVDYLTVNTQLEVDGEYVQYPDGSFTPINSSAWNAGRRFSFGYNYPHSSTNEHAFQIHTHLPSTGITGAYQKTGLLVYTTTAEDDAADTGSVVGIDTNGGVVANGGRAWGLVTKGVVASAVDGTTFALEVDSVNTGGTDVGTPGSANQKVGALFAAFGNNPSTVAVALTTGGTTWHHGFYSPTSALGTGSTDSFLQLVGKFTVRPTGFVEFGSSGPQITYGSGSPESVVTAPVGSIYLRSNGGAGTSIYVKESGSGNTGWVGK